MSNFPNFVDDALTLPNPSGTSTQNNPDHGALHTNENQAIIALENKIGTGSSTPTSGKVLTASGTGTSSWQTAYTPTQVDAAITTAVSSAKQAMYPVGCLYTETTGVNPGTTFGFGTWVAYGAGRVLVGKASSGTFATAGSTGGEETHILTTAEMPSHNHAHREWLFNGAVASGNHYGYGYTANTGSLAETAAATNTGEVQFGNVATGGDGAHNNLQPYVVVYMWNRTA